MKNNILTLLYILLTFGFAKAQVDGCSTPNIDSAFAVSLNYYNTDLLTNILQQGGYYDLQQISFPTPLSRQLIPF